jgi:hypothetical protein
VVICRNCGKDNQPGYRFCQECGSPLYEGGHVGAPSAAAYGRATGGVARARLVLVRPDGSDGGSHPLTEGVNLLGRGSGPLFDADSYLSPVHVRIEIGSGRNEGQFTVRDAGSLNGVFLKITEEEPLFTGSVFRVGQELLRLDSIRAPRLSDDGTEIMGAPNPGFWGRLCLIIGRSGDGKIQDGSCFPLYGDAVVLGRERGDILFSEDGYVSGTHARLSYRQGRVYLQDLASSNGTYLRIPNERVVSAGAFLLLGQQLFRISPA